MTVLIVDVQRGIVNEKLCHFEAFLKNLHLLVQAARENGAEVIYIQHDDGPGCDLTPGSPGFEIDSAVKPLPGEKIFVKTVNSPFRGTGLLEYLRERGEGELVVAGLQTDYCIDATVKCGFEHGFQMLVPAFANATVDNSFMGAEDSYRYYNTFLWPHRYARCLSMEELLQRLQDKF